MSPNVFALAGPPVAFTGETIRAFARVTAASPVAIAVAWIDFGDGGGVRAVPPGTCHPDPVRSDNVVNSAPVSHRYAMPGQHTIRIWARLGCASPRSLQYGTATVYTYLSATPAAAGWQRCQPGNLTATFRSLGAATGHVGAQVVLRNAGATSCHLNGFPRLQMLSAGGAEVRTRVHRGGSFLFPSVSPHLVGLAPGQSASFDLGYADVPAGNPQQPYQLACPAAAALVIKLPGDLASLQIAGRIAPCAGDIAVSPVVPGAAPIPAS